jgi:tetratricopeptide (TPR) repeat protein
MNKLTQKKSVKKKSPPWAVWGSLSSCLVLAMLIFAGCAGAADYIAKGKESTSLVDAEYYYLKAMVLEPNNAKNEKIINEDLIRRYAQLIKKGDDEAYQKALDLEPDNPDIYFARGWYYYYEKKDNQAAIKEWELALKKNPNYPVKNSVQGINIPANAAGKIGLKNLKNDLAVTDMSLNFMLGLAYYELVTRTLVPAAAFSESLDSAIAAFKKGYNLDITEGRHNTKDAKTLYLLYSGDVLVRKGDHAGAVKTYADFVNAKDIDYDKSGISAILQDLRAKEQAIAAYNALAAKGMYYVNARGSDNNDGLSEAKPFKTLAKAVAEAMSSGAETITVIGTLNDAGEKTSDENYVFNLFNGLMIDDGGKDNVTPILITGIPYGPPAKRAALSAAGTQKNCLSVIGKFRFEHIEISGSSKAGLNILVNSEVTLGNGALVKNNSGGGVIINAPKDELKEVLKPGSLILDGGIIENNKRGDFGGGVIVRGLFTMKRGGIRNNTASGTNTFGGGIYIETGEQISITGGDISGNKATGGGGVFVAAGRLTMSGGSVSGNTAEKIGGGLVIFENASLNQTGGSVTGNTAELGGGVFVAKGGAFNQRGGAVRNNKAPKSGDIFRQ